MTVQLLPRHDGHKAKAKAYYTANNNLIKYGFWILIAIVLISIAIRRLITVIRRNRLSLQGRNVAYSQVNEEDDHALARKDARGTVRKPQPISNSAIAWYRQAAYPRIAFPNRLQQYWSPPSRGECLVLGLYWAILMASMWTNVIFESESELYSIEWEVVGFRAAWVSTMQLPLLYATGCRINIISLITGVTHERLNWFHRWIARTLFITLIVHWASFYREWDLANFVQQEIKMMPMVIWGFAAWGAIGLMVITGFGWFREWSFELWLVSHIGLAWSVLALSYTHTHCTTYFVGASVAVLVFDLLGRSVLALFSNTRVTGGLAGLLRLGHMAKIEKLNESYLRLTVQNPTFSWRAGQHVYLVIPQIRLFQSHPFTIIGAYRNGQDDETCSMSFIIKAHSGFTKSLHESASKSMDGRSRVFFQGPYGNPPCLNRKHTIVLVSTGNRASYTTSLLQELSNNPGDIREIVVHLIVPNLEHFNWYKDNLDRCMSAFDASRINVAINIHVTKATGNISWKDAMAFGASDDVFALERDSIDSARSQSSSRSLINSAEVEKDIKMTDIQPPIPAPFSETSRDTDSNHNATSDLEKHMDEDDRSHLLQSDTTLVSNSSERETLPGGEKDLYNISYGRPAADHLLRTIISGVNPQTRVMVVAAVPPVLAADISKSVTRLIKAGAQSKASASDIELWVEENGS